MNLRKKLQDNTLSLGEHLHYLQKKKGLTNLQLSTAIGKDIRTVSRYKNGRIEIHPYAASVLAKALNISVDELTNSTIRLQRGLETRGTTLSYFDEDEGDAITLMSEIFKKEIFDALNNADIKTLNIVAKHRTALLEIHNYEWEFIKYALQLAPQFDSIKEFMYEYQICPEAFIDNINSHNIFLYEIKAVLRNDMCDIHDDKSTLVDDILKTPFKLVRVSQIKIETLLEGIQYLNAVSEEIWDMLILFAQLHDYILIGEPSNKQCLVLEYMKKLSQNSV